MGEFEPLVVGFVCNECVYAAADLAGTSRLSYPPNIRLIRVPCSGQVDTLHILRAFENGADGVFVGGCLREQCHYVNGNEKAEARVMFLKKVLGAAGLEEERLSMHFMSAAMGSEFARVAVELTTSIRKLGPSPLKNREVTSLTSGDKRTNLRNILLSIASGLGREPEDFSEDIRGYGEPAVDGKKCLGCGACAFVCRNGAIVYHVIDDKVRLDHTYWRCTACGGCEDACPVDCMEVIERFDLPRLLSDEVEQKAEVGMLSCLRCGTCFIPVLLKDEVRDMLGDDALSESYLGLCPSCRRVTRAESLLSVHAREGEWKRIGNRGGSSH